MKDFVKNHKLSLVALLIGGALIYVRKKDDKKNKKAYAPANQKTVKAIPTVQVSSNENLPSNKENNSMRHLHSMLDDGTFNVPQAIKTADLSRMQERSESPIASAAKPISYPMPSAIEHSKSQPVYQAKIIGSSTGKIYQTMQEFRNQNVDNTYRIEYIQCNTIRPDGKSK